MKRNKPTRSQKILLKPTPSQDAYLTWLVGARRYIQNWAVEYSNAHYSQLGRYPTKRELLDAFMQLREIPENTWLNQVPAPIYQRVLGNIVTGFVQFFNDRKNDKKPKRYKRKPPKINKRYHHDSFYVSNDHGYIQDGHFKCPGLKAHIKVTEAPRFGGKILCYTVVRERGQWFVVVTFEFDKDPKHRCKNSTSAVGVDLGIANQVTLSTGEQYSIRDLTKLERKRRYLQKCLGRKQKGSKNYNKTLRKLQRTYTRMSNQRSDDTHKITTTIAKNHGIVVLEDLDIQAMYDCAKWRKLRSALKMASMSEFKKQLIYKCQKVFMVDRFFPSSQICSKCGHRHKMPLNVRTYVCPECGLVIDRDVNAAINILAQYISGRGTPVVSC